MWDFNSSFLLPIAEMDGWRADKSKLPFWLGEMIAKIREELIDILKSSAAVVAHTTQRKLPNTSFLHLLVIRKLSLRLEEPSTVHTSHLSHISMLLL